MYETLNGDHGDILVLLNLWVSLGIVLAELCWCCGFHL